MMTVLTIVALGGALLAHIRCAELAARAAKAESDLTEAACTLMALGEAHGWDVAELDRRAAMVWARRVAEHQAAHPDCPGCSHG